MARTHAVGKLFSQQGPAEHDKDAIGWVVHALDDGRAQAVTGHYNHGESCHRKDGIESADHDKQVHGHKVLEMISNTGKENFQTITVTCHKF